MCKTVSKWNVTHHRRTYMSEICQQFGRNRKKRPDIRQTEKRISRTSLVLRRTCRMSWFLITCNWWIIALSRLCLSSIVGAAPITDRMLSMTSPLTWHHPTSGPARSQPFPLPYTQSELPLTSGSHPPDSQPSGRWSGDRRAGTALRFLAAMVSWNQCRLTPKPLVRSCHLQRVILFD